MPPPPQGLFCPSHPSTSCVPEGREGKGGWRSGPNPVPGRGWGGPRVCGLLSCSWARALAQRSLVLSLAPERSPPGPPRSLDSRLAAPSLPHSLSRPPDSAAAPPLQLRLSQELPQRPDVTAPPPPQTRQEEGGERRARGACAGRAWAWAWAWAARPSAG